MTGAEERRVRLDDGVATTLQQWGIAGPLVVAVHGMTSSRRSWARLGGRLAPRFRLVAYDQRGHGDLAGVPGPMRLVQGERDLDAVVASLGEPVSALIGHSWGGAIAIRAGRRLPVARVAALDPMLHQADDAWYGEYLDELRAHFTLQGEARDAFTRHDNAGWHADDIEGKVHAMHAMTTEPIANLLRENPAADWDLRSDVAGYPKPLLLLMADRDLGINRAEWLDAIQAQRSPEVAIEVAEGQGHNLHRTDFEAVAARVERFLVGR